MSDLISRQDAIQAIEDLPNAYNGWSDTYDKACIIGTLDEIPSADAVDVVRCGECKHMMADGRCMEFADDGIRPSAMDYCSYGARREDGEE